MLEELTLENGHCARQESSASDDAAPDFAQDVEEDVEEEHDTRKDWQPVDPSSQEARIDLDRRGSRAGARSCRHDRCAAKAQHVYGAQKALAREEEDSSRMKLRNSRAPRKRGGSLTDVPIISEVIEQHCSLPTALSLSARRTQPPTMDERS